MTDYKFTGETPVLYPSLPGYPVEGEWQNLYAEPGETYSFEGEPPPGPWAEVTVPVKTAKAGKVTE